MRFFHKTVVLFTLLIATQVKSFTPESGFYWTHGEPGSGYSIEIQDNFLFMALYVYDDLGNPIWYTANATLGGNSLFNAQLNYSFNGTCIDCNYTEPTTIFGERGPISITWLSETTATIQFQGVVKTIERFNFLLGDEADRMLGEWHAVIDFSSTGAPFPFAGEVLVYEFTSESNGDKFAEGCRPSSSLQGFCTNLARDIHESYSYYDFVNDELIIVVDDSPDFILVYYVQQGLDQFDGVAERYPKSSGPNNIFYPVRGFRSASRSFVETGVGPAKKSSDNTIKTTGISDSIDFKITPKPLSDFSKEDQAKISRRHSVVKKILNYMESK